MLGWASSFYLPAIRGRAHCPRSRHVEHLILRGLLCLPCRLGAGGATRCPHGGQSRLIGPSRVSPRILEASLMKRFHPMVSARLSVALHPLGAVVLGAFGAGTASAVFTVLHGAGSGILTVARGAFRRSHRPLRCRRLDFLFGFKHCGVSWPLLFAHQRGTACR
jgi:hypothetical protein